MSKNDNVRPVSSPLKEKIRNCAMISACKNTKKSEK